uniref:JAZF zinc finger 1 n=1 Tax=Equus asinus TaxID=9793 RepID=A0A9L0IRN3_EQUAS
MTGIAAASFFSNTCRFGGCGLHFPTLADLIEHIEDNHIEVLAHVTHSYLEPLPGEMGRVHLAQAIQPPAEGVAGADELSSVGWKGPHDAPTGLSNPENL